MVKPSALKPYFKSIGRYLSIFMFFISHRHCHIYALFVNNCKFMNRSTNYTATRINLMLFFLTTLSLYPNRIQF